MPRQKTARGNKSRKLWLEIKFVAPGATRDEVKQTLINAIRRGDYRYPRTWKVGLYWRNSFSSPMRSGEFSREMRASRESSPGFDIAVIDYLQSSVGGGGIRL
jgi:hypothetical protein